MVCERELGLILDKSEQTSNWAQRPLSAEQLRYAALDAEVLLVLYERLGATTHQAIEDRGREHGLRRRGRARLRREDRIAEPLGSESTRAGSRRRRPPASWRRRWPPPTDAATAFVTALAREVAHST